eukprot:5559515-Prorocentrum_lima.AAC.1
MLGNGQNPFWRTTFAGWVGACGPHGLRHPNTCIPRAWCSVVRGGGPGYCWHSRHPTAMPARS